MCERGATLRTQIKAVHVTVHVQLCYLFCLYMFTSSSSSSAVFLLLFGSSALFTDIGGRTDANT